MSKYYGNILEDDTIELTFNTFNSSGASVTVTTFASTDVHVHKDGGLTQTNAGVTIDIDFDAIVGNHMIFIDTSADAFYATGSNYEVRVEGITVDSQTINAFIGSFSIENRFMRGTDSAALASTLNTKVPNNLNTTVSGNIGIDWANVENPTTALDLSGTDIQLVDTASTVTDGAKDATVAKDSTVAKEATINTKIPNNLNTTVSGNIGIDWANVENPTTALDLSGTDIQLVDTASTVTDGAKDSTVAKDATVGKEATLDSMSGATFNTATDSLEAIRNRGDAAWTTGAGGDATEAKQDTILAKLLSYVRILSRKDSAIATDDAAQVTEINADEGAGAGAYTNTTDSQEAIKDAITGGGGTPHIE